MQSTIDISVVIPVYNREQTVSRCVFSVLGQTLLPREIIIVDDGSSDDSLSVIRSIQSAVVDIVIIEQENAGANAARNAGVKKARFEWIAFHDSDDVWLPQRLEVGVDALNYGREQVGSDVLFISSSFYSVKEGHSDICKKPDLNVTSADVGKRGNHEYIFMKEPLTSQILLNKNFVSTQTMLVERKTLESVGMFDEGMGRFQDWEIAIRIAKVATFVFIKEPLVLTYEQSNSISKGRRAGVIAKERLLSLNSEAYDKYYLQTLGFRIKYYIQKMMVKLSM